MTHDASPAPAQELLASAEPTAEALGAAAAQSDGGQGADQGALPPANQAIVWLFRAYNATMNELATSLRPLGLSPSAFHVLQTLAGSGDQELEPCELANRLLVSRPSVTGLIDTLEAKSLVSRRRHPADRRRVLVGLTEGARALLGEHAPEHDQCLRRVAGQLSADELASLTTLLRKIHGAMPPEARGAGSPLEP